MKTLPITIFFLLLMALLAYGSLNVGLDRMIEVRATQGALQAQRSAHNGWEQTVYLVEKGRRLPRGTRPPKPKLTIAKGKGPPKKQAPIVYPTKLNVAQCFKKSSQGKLYREVCESLLCQLYADYPPFQSIPQGERALLERVREALKEKRVLIPEHLATLDLEELTPLWQQLLLGDGCPALLDYVYYKSEPNSAPTINITWAPSPLLQVLFQDPQRADNLSKLQQKLAKNELEEEESDPLLAQYKEAARLEDSPYAKILICQLPTKSPTHTIVGRDSQTNQMESRHHMQ